MADMKKTTALQQKHLGRRINSESCKFSDGLSTLIKAKLKIA